MEVAAGSAQPGQESPVLAVRYDGFVSYSHAGDDLLAPRLQAGLQRFAKPWWRRRGLRIFRDESSLSANPHLWSSIVEALEASEWFILLTSPEAAFSQWVDREVAWWLEHKSGDRILPVLTDGDLAWDEVSSRLDSSSSVPPSLLSAFSEEPRWVDMRWARSDAQLDLGNSRFRSAVADIASTLRGVAKDELESEEVRQHRRTLRTAWGAVALLAVLAVAAITAAAFAFDQARIAGARGLAARATALAPTRIDLSLLLAVEGVRSHDSLETRAGLLTALNAAQYLKGFRDEVGRPYRIAASGKGEVFATLADNGEVQLWDPTTWTPRGAPLGNVGLPVSIDVSADGSHVVGGGADGAFVWNVATGQQVGPTIPPDPDLGPILANLSPSGDILLTSSFFDPVWQVQIWRLADGEQMGRLDLGTEEGLGWGSADFSPDGSRIYASSEGGGLAVFDTLTLESSARRRVDEGGVQFGNGIITVSPGGDVLATGTLVPATITILDANTLDAVGSPVVPRVGGRLHMLSFSPDGTRLLGQTDDGTVTVIDLLEGHKVTSLTGRTGSGAGAVWLDANRLASATPNGGVTEWDLRRTTVIGNRVSQATAIADLGNGTLVSVGESGVLTETSPDGTSEVIRTNLACWELAVSADTSLAAAGCSTFSEGDDVAVLVDLAAESEMWRRPLPGFASSLSFSPDQKLLAIGSYGGELTVWDTTTGEAAVGPITLDPWIITAVGWTPDGKSLMVGGQLGSVKFLETGTWEQTSEMVLEPNQTVLTEFALHPDGRRMFVASESGVVWVVDLETRQVDGDPLDASGTELQGVAVSPDGSLVVATSRDGGIRVWEATSRRAVGPTLKGHEAGAYGIEFGTSGLYTSGFDSISGQPSTIRWTLDPKELAAIACGLVGRNLTRSEWAEYVPDADYRASCPQFPAGD